jgi:hypothetical protein
MEHRPSEYDFIKRASKPYEFWHNVIQHIANFIRATNPSVIGLQEAGRTEDLTELPMIKENYNHHINIQGPACLLTLWRKDLGELSVESSSDLADGHKNGRPISIIRTTKGYLLVNLHSPHRLAEDAQQTLLSDRLQPFFDGPIDLSRIFVMGDFNNPRYLNSNPLRLRQVTLTPGNDVETKSCCYSSRALKLSAYRRGGDYCFGQNNRRPLAVFLSPMDSEAGSVASDHEMVFASFASNPDEPAKVGGAKQKRELRMSFTQQTRKQRAGKILGEGAHGKTYDASCRVHGESFCKTLEAFKADIQKVTLYTNDKKLVITASTEIDFFAEYARTLVGNIAKIFKHRTVAARQKALDEEIASNKAITELYGANAEENTTIAPVSGYIHKDKKYDIYGAAVDIKGQPSIHVVFGAKCNNKFPFHPNMITNLLESLIVLNRKEYLHNDVKLDNIVLCDERYKLIDWGASTPMDFTNKTHGSLLTTSPLRWYCYGYTAVVARNIIPTKTYFYKPDIHKSPLFKEQVERINAEFNTLLSFESDRRKLFEAHKNTFDVFMLGMTILHAVIERKLAFDVYRPIIAAFTSLLEPLTARRALNYL